MIHYLAIAVLLTYLIASLFYLYAVIRRVGKSAYFGKIFIVVAFLLHTILIIPFFTFEASVVPENRGAYFFWISWALPLVCILGRKHFDYPIVGAFIAPLCALFFSGSSYLAHHLVGNPEIRADATIILVHVIPALLAEICLVVAFIISCIFLILDNRIRRKKIIALDSPGPSLENLEVLNHKALTVGFVAMTLAIVSGTIWALTSHRTFFAGDYYQWISIVVWLLLALMLHVRTNLEWSAKRLSKTTIILTSLMMTAILIMILLKGNSIHGNYGQ